MNSMTGILLTVSVLFLLTTAPISIYIMRNVTLQLHADAVEKAQLSLLWACLNLLLYTNNALNFVLYLMSGPRFRRELCKMLCSKKTNVIQPITEDTHVRRTLHKTQSGRNRVHPVPTENAGHTNSNLQHIPGDVNVRHM